MLNFIGTIIVIYAILLFITKYTLFGKDYMIKLDNWLINKWPNIDLDYIRLGIYGVMAMLSVIYLIAKIF